MAGSYNESGLFGDAPIRALTAQAVPREVSERVLKFLNRVRSPAALFRAVELLGEEERGLALALAIVEERRRLGKFTDLSQVERVEGLGPARFTELVLALGTDPDPVVPDISQGDVQPTTPRFSASITELEFSYQVLAEGPLQGQTGTVLARACSACNSSQAAFNRELNVWEAQVEITALVLDGENDDFVFSITMDQRMQPYDWMHPLDRGAKRFQFPAKMQLNNSMVLKTRNKHTGEVTSLVSRDVPCQVGRVTSWPPYGMRLHTQDRISYFDAEKPLDQPVLQITDGTTYLLGPCAFFAHRADILDYEYVPARHARDLPAVRLTWRPMPEGVPGSEFHDHYHVYRSPNPALGVGSWVNVSGHVKENTWVDPNPPRGPLYYRVVPVLVTALGDDYEGFPGQEFRVEPARSVFRV